MACVFESELIGRIVVDRGKQELREHFFGAIDLLHPEQANLAAYNKQTAEAENVVGFELEYVVGETFQI